MLLIKKIRHLAVLFLAVQFSVTSMAAPAGNLFSAEVPVSARTAEAKEVATANALALVLVKVSGDRQVVRTPAASDLLQRADEYVQQFRYTPNKTLLLAFDGRRLQSDMRAAGMPVWGSDRPGTLVWMVVDEGDGERRLIGADTQGEVRTQIEDAAASRGVPLIWPLFDSADQALLTEADVWGNFEEPIQQASARYGADAILVVKLARSASGGLFGGWTLQAEQQPLQWRSSIGQGINRIADHYASRLASVSLQGSTTQSVMLSLTELNSGRAYARAVSSLEKLSVVEQINVVQVSGSEAQLMVKLRGDASALRRALSFSRDLEENSQGQSTGVLSYRYKR